MTPAHGGCPKSRKPLTPGLYPAQKSNLLDCPCQTFWTAVWPLSRRGLPGRKRANAAFYLLEGLGCHPVRRRGANGLTRPDTGETVRGPLRSHGTALCGIVSPLSVQWTGLYPQFEFGRSSPSETGQSAPGRRLPSSRPAFSFQPGRDDRASSFPCRRHGTG